MEVHAGYDWAFGPPSLALTRDSQFILERLRDAKKICRSLRCVCTSETAHFMRESVGAFFSMFFFSIFSESGF